MSQPFDKPGQPKLLPGRRPIIQKAERPSPQYSQSKIRVKILVPEIPLQNLQNIMIRPFQNLIVQFHKQCQSMIQF